MEDNPDMTQKVTTDMVKTMIEKEAKKQIREVSAVHIVLKKQLEF